MRLLKDCFVLIEYLSKFSNLVALENLNDFDIVFFIFKVSQLLKHVIQFLSDCLSWDQVFHLVDNLLRQVIDVKLEAMFFRQFYIFRWVLLLIGEHFNFTELFDELLLLTHLFVAHDLANRNFKGSQAANVSNIDMKQTL